MGDGLIGMTQNRKGMMFRKRKKVRVIGHRVLFEEGGKEYSYNKSQEDMEEIVRERAMIRQELPFRVTGISSDGSEFIWINDHEVTKST